MITENLSTLKIHKLSQEQYDRELAAGRIDENAIYLTPDERAEQVQSDWAQNDPSAVDYIRGRTHSAIWSEGVIFDGVLEPDGLDSMDFAAEFDFSNFLMLHTGAEYNITIDGQNYVSTLRFYSMEGTSIYTFGNVGIMIPGLPVSEEPFIILLIPDFNAISLMVFDGSLAPGVQKAMTISGDFVPYVTEDEVPGDYFIERLDKGYLPTEIALLPEACEEMWYDIDNLKDNLDSKVSYTVSQSLSDSQKAQARQNIGAASASEMTQVQADLSETNTEAKSYVNGVLQERHLPGYLPTEPQLDFKGFSDTPALTLTMAEEDWTKSWMSGYYTEKEADLNFTFDSRTSLRCIIDGTYYTLYPFIKEGNVFAWSTSDKATFLGHSFEIHDGVILIRSATKFSKVEFYETQIRMDMENRQLPPEAIPLHFPTRSETKTLIETETLITLDDIDAICNQSIESASEVLL